MYTITKEFHFSASHQLFGLSKGHQCSRVHGHNYKVIVELCATKLNDVGFIIDYGDLHPLKDYIDSKMDHKHLAGRFDDVPPGIPFHDCYIMGYQTSAENIAKHLFDFCDDLGWPIYRVGVSETPKTWAWYMHTHEDNLDCCDSTECCGTNPCRCETAPCCEEDKGACCPCKEPENTCCMQLYCDCESEQEEDEPKKTQEDTGCSCCESNNKGHQSWPY